MALQLLSGQADALTSLRVKLDLPWYDVLTATLLYVNPAAQSYDIPCVTGGRDGRWEAEGVQRRVFRVF